MVVHNVKHVPLSCGSAAVNVIGFLSFKKASVYSRLMSSAQPVVDAGLTWKLTELKVSLSLGPDFRIVDGFVSTRIVDVDHGATIITSVNANDWGSVDHVKLSPSSPTVTPDLDGLVEFMRRLSTEIFGF